ncbi:methionine ABC transporter permease [Anoxybacter fermentans]|uniref:Methionine ABC transporter permease n=1 Tax=Anoxybacter fermentans TaxID=1323375 RepID=A0A3Q9HNE9_9FIRM|nr:methionine ABC transporter permease [Anoxybacter fermentans]AZR72010.1 methionine ABC transporter permease [Anoxybacter fermentans]
MVVMYAQLSKHLPLLMEGLRETLYMVGVSVTFASLLGIPLGVLVVVTEKGHIFELRWLNLFLGWLVNVARSVPFIILMIAIIPLTRAIVGTSIGTSAAIVPLTVSAIPFVARIVETSLKEVDVGVIEAAQAMGANRLQIILKVLIPEALPSLILGMTITTISLVGYSAMAGAIGGGGLGDLAIRYGYQRFRGDIMLETVILLVLLVQGIQWMGNRLARRFNHK